MLTENCDHGDGGSTRRKDTVVDWDVMGLILQSPLPKESPGT